MVFKQKFFTLLIILAATARIATAQDVDLFKSQDEQDKKDKLNQTDYVTATFKTTRMVNGQSIENVGEGILDVKVSHRFGTISQGSNGMWGLDAATMRIGMDYGITNGIMVGLGRTNGGLFDGFAKWRILRQSTGKVNMPFTVSLSGGAIWNTQKVTNPIENNYTDRLNYSGQILIARKFNDYVSLQVVPTIVHYNSVAKSSLPNDYFSVGMGGRLRLTKRVNLTAEYYPQITKKEGTTSSFSVGFDIETGGHVFQFHFTNSTGMDDRSFIEETKDSWNSTKGIHFGFNIARVFKIVEPKNIK